MRLGGRWDGDVEFGSFCLEFLPGSRWIAKGFWFVVLRWLTIVDGDFCFDGIECDAFISYEYLICAGDVVVHWLNLQWGFGRRKDFGVVCQSAREMKMAAWYLWHRWWLTCSEIGHAH